METWKLNRCSGSTMNQAQAQTDRLSTNSFRSFQLEKLIRTEKTLSRIHGRHQITTPVVCSVSLSSLANSNSSSYSYLMPSSSSHCPKAFGPIIIIQHNSHSPLKSPERDFHPEDSLSGTPLNYLDSRKVQLRFASYNIRGIKRFGRQTELSHLLSHHKLDIIGIQQQLAHGYLLNSSDTTLHGREETRGTGLIFKKHLAPSLRKLYQGNSRWCGALFLAKPVPILVLSVYAPTAAADIETKMHFYQDIGEIIRENGGALVIILGDFNARILTNPGLPRHVGNNVFPSARPLGEQSEEILENRDLFLDFLIQNDLVALNTLMPGRPQEQITFRHPGQPNFTPPWSEHNFAQIDYILTKCRFRNMFAEVKPQPHLDYDSDHLPIVAKLKVHWYFGSPPKPAPAIRHLRKCTPEAKAHYNAALKQKERTWTTVRQDISELAQAH